MATTLLTKIFGSRNDRLLKQFRKTADRINAMEPQLEGLSDEQLRGKTLELKGRVAAGEALDAVYELRVAEPVPDRATPIGVVGSLCN